MNETPFTPASRLAGLTAAAGCQQSTGMRLSQLFSIATALPDIHVRGVLQNWMEHGNYTPQLFPSVVQDDGQEGRPADEKLRRLDATLDHLRARFGRNVVCLGAAQEARDSAPMRISFTHIPDIQLEGDD